MRKMFVLFLVVLLLVSFVAALPASARGGGKPGVTPPGWAQLGPQPGWTHVNPGQGGTEPPGAGHCYLHVLGGR
jgi:hypothetical protein